MELTLPDFSYPYLETVCVCGIIDPVDAQVPDSKTHIETRIEDFAGWPFWMQLILNSQSDPDGTHLHLDLCLETSFPDSEIPNASGDRGKVFDAIELYKDKPISATVRTFFALKASQLPKDGMIALFSQDKPDTDVRLTGGTMTFKRGPIDSIRWQIDEDDEEEVNVQIRSSFQGVLGSDYLVNCYAPARKAIQSLVLEKESG